MTQSRGSILVVDDTVENLRLLATMLGEQDYEARPVRSGAEALQAASHTPPDLVLLDISMPDMDGYETCTRLKAMNGLEDVPIIFLTALGTLPDKVKGFEVGGADYVTKPFQIEEVMARVRVHLELRRTRVELARNLESLRSLEQLRDDLIHMVVHDMRSPLMVLMANLQYLRDSAAGALEGERLSDLEDAARAAGVVNSMANDLLDISRMEEGKFPLNPVSTDLVGLAGKVCTSLAMWQRERILGVEPTTAIVAVFDPDIIRRVIENLVTNAIKHTPAKGGIRVLITTGLKVRVAVMDEGSGVPLEARKTIFEKFGTVAARQERAYHSAGLGLAFCKLAVEAHGGEIGVESGGNVGSTFWFELPAGETKIYR